MKIEIKKDGKDTRAVFVDGVRWGHFGSSSLGLRGAVYTLYHHKVTSDVDGVPVLGFSPVRKPMAQGNRSQQSNVQVYSDCIYNDIRCRGVANHKPFVPLDQRLLDAVTEALKKGWFESAASRLARSRAAAEEAKKVREKRAVEYRKRFEKKIDEVLKGVVIPAGSTPDMGELRNRVYSAMDWAQHS